MPVGLQIVGRSHCEDDVVRAAAAFEGTFAAGHNVKSFQA
jgi:aspartyl-tRNA(Asn)/glutamyl-tRNA(Gln) amidotransferase subunit A